MDRLRALCVRYRELIRYGIFGVLTTLVNYLVYFVSTRAFSLHEIPATVLSFLLSVLFAYVTNRRYVFLSRAQGWEVLLELLKFYAGRVFSGLLDLSSTYLFITRMGWYDVPVKIVANVVIIVLNYVLSKWIVFRRRGEKKASEAGEKSGKTD